MESLILTRDGLQIADTPMPPLMPGDVRIEVRSVGIGETDISIWIGEQEADLPIILGYEFVGVIHESSVSDLQPGILVTSEIDVGCNRCVYCRSGQHQFCESKKTLGKTRDGALAEYISVPADLVHPLPSGINRITGTFVEPLASAIRTREDVPPENGESVAVIGCGERGLLVAQVYEAFGADVYLTGNNRWKLGIARQLGMTNTINWSEQTWKKKILDNTEGIGPRIVIETTGSMEGINHALDLVRGGGTLALTRIPDQNGMIPLSKIIDKGIRLIGNNRGRFQEAIDMLDKRRIEVARLVNKEYNLEEGSKAFEQAAKPSVAKVIINV